MRSKTKQPQQPKTGIEIVKGALMASAFALSLVIIYAVLLYYGVLPLSSVELITTTFKALGGMVAAIVALRRVSKHRILVGAAAGALFALLAYMVFAILADSFALSLALLGDIALGAGAGIVSTIALEFFK